MKIAFDAKRAFHNFRGLGNYSRDTIRILSAFYPENQYYLFNPKSKGKIELQKGSNQFEINPQSFLGKAMPSLWRSAGLNTPLKSLRADIYHGLSQELPLGIAKSGTASVVTMHDAIFMRYPELYSSSYRAVFIRKNQYACRVANKIVAISEQTKRDIVQYFGADETKIDVVYQGCNNIFREEIGEELKKQLRQHYQLPEQFILNIGAIEKRKNAAFIVEAMHRAKVDLPLVIVGKPTDYMAEITATAQKYNRRVMFIHDAATKDLPAIYSMADVFVYPSVFEGFGIPVLEALCTQTPVITSTGTCFEETGGLFTKYVNPQDADELGNELVEVLSNSQLREQMKREGLIFSQRFTDEEVATNLMNVYKSVL